MFIAVSPPHLRLHKFHVTVQQVTNVDWASFVPESFYYETLKAEDFYVTMRK